MTRNEKIIAAVDSGKSFGQVAAEFDISRSAVSGIILRHRQKRDPALDRHLRQSRSKRNYERYHGDPEYRARRLAQRAAYYARSKLQNTA